MVKYRKCREKDLLPAFRMVRTSINFLRRRTGKDPKRNGARRSPGLDHLFRLDRETFWCAWSGNNIIGFAGALVRGKQWFLAFLFVHPRYQNRGVGKQLIRRVWRDGPGVSHSLATFAYNMQAVGTYSQFGLAPICALPIMQVAIDKLRQPEPTGLKTRTRITRQDIAWINRLEAKIRGYSHPQEWRFWSKSDEVQIYLFEDRGKRVGYSMFYRTGGIAPAGAVSNRYLVKVVAETLRLVEPTKKRIRLCCPAPNMNLYRFLIGSGFRLLEMDLFMTDRPYADFQRYVPAELAIF